VEKLTLPVIVENQLGVVRSDQDLHQALRDRANQLNIARETIDDIAGLTRGHSSKLLAPQQIKRFGPLSRWLLLQALGLKLVLVEDTEALAQIKSRMVKRNANNARHAGTVSFLFSRRHMRAIQRRGGENSRKYLPKYKVRALARKAGIAGARARWGNTS
jgi:hypothetical protein